ncbi:MAG: histidinol-phosphatase [Roseburia sp.]|nr:histidinol-phosphatase [Roseburia sp.]
MHTIRINFHTHTKRCKHAIGSEEDYIKSAIANGISQLGISDHGPFPDVDLGWRMLFQELEDYLETLDTLAQKYQDDIIIRKGLEIEYLPEYLAYYETLLDRFGLDYLLMGEHIYINSNGEHASTYGINVSTKQYLDYARTMAEGMRTGLFKIAAHPDLYLLNPFSWNDDCKRAADLIINTAIATDTILEYNANGLRQEQRSYPDGIRYPYPHNSFWQMASQTNVRVIVGSDCHDPECLWDEAVKLAFQNLEKLGIIPITETGI